jgi:AraC-like DNA-binding protein
MCRRTKWASLERKPSTRLSQVTLVFNLGPALCVQHPVETRTTYPAGTAFYAGLSSTYVVTETQRSQEGAQVMLTPLGARCLIGFPLDEVGDRLIDPAELFGAAAQETIERLQETNSHTGRLAILEREMTRQLALDRKPLPRDLVWALARLEASFGQLGVNALAAELGCSRKHLVMRFRREFGMPLARISVAVPKASETRRAVRSSLVANATRTWQLSRIALFGP